MKIVSIILKRVFPLLLFVAGSRMVVQAQSSKADKKAEQRAAMKSLVESQNYDFKAQSVTPMGGRTRQLTSDYDLRVTKGSLVCYLPYFGQAYTAPIDPSKGGIQFTSKDFDYTISEGKKGGWEAMIKPKDNQDVQQMALSISQDGYATLQVVSNQRQAISFYGTITAIKPPKK
jgi:Domain of unknown function (DUF4251)